MLKSIVLVKFVTCKLESVFLQQDMIMILLDTICGITTELQSIIDQSIVTWHMAVYPKRYFSSVVKYQ